MAADGMEPLFHPLREGDDLSLIPRGLGDRRFPVHLLREALVEWHDPDLREIDHPSIQPPEHAAASAKTARADPFRADRHVTIGIGKALGAEVGPENIGKKTVVARDLPLQFPRGNLQNAHMIIEMRADLMPGCGDGFDVLAAVLLALFKPAAAKASVEIVGRAGAVRAKDIAAHRPGRTWYVVEADADASPIHAQRAPADGNALGDSQPRHFGFRQ